MPRASKGIRLWLEPEERDGVGRLVRRATWVIRDGMRKVRTGRTRDDREGADRADVAQKRSIRRTNPGVFRLDNCSENGHSRDCLDFRSTGRTSNLGF